MLSIIPFDRVTSSAPGSGSRDPERPFKAYPRTPVSVPAATSYYGPFTPPTFVGSVNIPASHTSTSLKSVEDTTSPRHHSGASTMDPTQPSAHSYSSYGSSNPSDHHHMPHLMDISGHPSHSYMRHRGDYSHSGMGMSIPHTPVSVKAEHTQHSATNLSMNTSPTALGSSSSSSSTSLGHSSSSTPVHHPHHPGLYHGGAGGASHHSGGGSSAASGGSPPGGHGPLGTAAGHSSSSNDSSPGGSSNNDDDASTPRMPPKKRPHNVPEESKDANYWEKRKKNNESAKRSRDARRMKEEQIAMRVVYLEQENLQLRTEVSLLKNEIEKLRCMLYNS